VNGLQERYGQKDVEELFFELISNHDRQAAAQAC
jgi:hypothetical protein